MYKALVRLCTLGNETAALPYSVMDDLFDDTDVLLDL